MPSPSGTVIGTVSRQASRETGLAEGTRVVTGGHDHICGALAVGVFEESRALDSCGTTETLLLSLERVPLTEEAFQQELVFGCHVARGTYYMLAALYTSGIIVRWFQEQFAPETLRNPKTYQQLIEEARQIPPGADGVFFLPHFRGSSSLPVDPLSRGTFLGILSHHTRANLFRAIIEGLCYEIRSILNVMTSTSGITVDSLRVIGSARNDFWLQTKADILQVDLEIPDVTEGTCLGAALLAGIGTGVYRDERDAFTQTYRPGQKYHPNQEHTERYNRLYHEIFRSIYSTVVPLHHKIADVMREE
jgi:xylulokinase